ncbi:MAG TPA: tripartite tricarboxylate transporter TctB family protein [Methylomirabilota bacterium]
MRIPRVALGIMRESSRGAMLGQGLALLLAALGIAAAVEAWRRIPVGTADAPGPGLLPLILGLGVAGLGVGTALGGAWPPAAPLERRRALAVAGAVVAWALALPYLGFGLTTVVALFLLARGVGEAPLSRLLVFALLAGGAAILLFRGLLNLPLPRGPWGW